MARAPRVTARIGSRIDRLSIKAISVATAAAPSSATTIRRIDTSAAFRARASSSSMFFWFRSSTASASRLMSLKVGRSWVK